MTSTPVVTYLSHFDYLDAPEGLETASLLGGSFRVNGGIAAGVVTLPVTGATVALGKYDEVVIFDGPQSEIVQASGNMSAGSIPLLTGTLYAHADGVAVCTKGTQGHLGKEIVKASAWMENKCRQSLWQSTQTETLRMPSMRASIDNQQVLTFRTKQFPITAITALQMGANQVSFISYDPAQAFIDSNELVTVPQLIQTGTGSSTYSLVSPQVSRQQNAYLQVTYTAGYTASTLPQDVKDAGVLRTSALLSRRQNPAGADSIRLGDKQLQATQRGDTSPYDLLSKQALDILSNYTLRMF